MMSPPTVSRSTIAAHNYGTRVQGAFLGSVGPAFAHGCHDLGELSVESVKGFSRSASGTSTGRSGSGDNSTHGRRSPHLGLRPRQGSPGGSQRRRATVVPGPLAHLGVVATVVALNHYSTTSSRKAPVSAVRHRTRTRSAPDRIRAGHGPFPQVVAGVGFEPT